MPKSKTKANPKYDRRLLGTWKSDRRRTFRNYKPVDGVESEAFEKFKGIFGKLVIRYGRGRYYSDYSGSRSTGSYRIVARDNDSVVIQSWEDRPDRNDDAYRAWQEFGKEKCLTQIFFAKDHIFLVVRWVDGFCEFFKRVK